jgi:hypothetical protein
MTALALAKLFTCGLAAAAAGPRDWEDVRPQRERQRGNGSSQTLSVFLFLEEIYRDLLLLLPGGGLPLLFHRETRRGGRRRRANAAPLRPRGGTASASASLRKNRISTRPGRPRSARQARRQHPESRGGITPTALAGCARRFSLGLPPSSTCALRIEGNDRPETRCRTEGIDSRPVFLSEFLQPARLALSFSATSIR